MTAAVPARLRRPDGLREIADGYDGFLLDAWGTLHTGGAVLAEALAAVRRLRGAGKRIAVVSNTPQLGGVLAERLAGQGLQRELFDVPVTAGDLAHAALAEASHPWLAATGRRALHLAPERFPGLLPGTPYVAVAGVEAADLLVNGGPARDDTPLEDFLELFRRAVDRDLPMVCANPDRAIVDQGVRKMCAGELAAAYEEIGGRVLYFGKPHPEVFDRALRLIGTATERTLVVGDGLATDIAGARAAGLDSLLVAGGLDAGVLTTAAGQLVEDLEAALAELSPAVRPDFAVAALRW